METLTLQQFFTLINKIVQYLIPVVIFILLIYLIKVLSGITKTIKETTKRVNQLEKTIQLVDENLSYLVTTTKSVANVAQSVDSAHLKSKEKIVEYKDKISSTVLELQNKGKTLIKKGEKS